MFVGEFDEHVFKTGGERANFCDGDAVFQQLLAEIIEIEAVIDERVDGLAKNGGAANAGEMAANAKSTRDFASGDFAQVNEKLAREHPGRTGVSSEEILSSEILLQGFGVREILRRLLVQVGNHFLSGGRNGDSTLENNGFCLDLLAINALIGVVVRANC